MVGTTVPTKGQEGVYMALRTRTVTQHFEGSLLADDYLGRVEMEMAKLGFTYETAIGEEWIDGFV